MEQSLLEYLKSEVKSRERRKKGENLGGQKTRTPHSERHLFLILSIFIHLNITNTVLLYSLLSLISSEFHISPPSDSLRYSPTILLSLMTAISLIVAAHTSGGIGE